MGRGVVSAGRGRVKVLGWEDMSVEELLPEAAQNPEAQYQLARHFFAGTGGVEADPVKAAEWLKKAAEQGDPSAQGRLGWACLKGAGVERDSGLAVNWLRRAADQGVASARRNLGCCFETGTGAEQNLSAAAQWYARAAEQGDAYGQYFLAECLAAGEGVEKDEAKAQVWYKKAVQKGVPQSAKVYFTSCLYPHPVEMSPLTAVSFLMNAPAQADPDDIEAMNSSLTPAAPGHMTMEQIMKM